MSVIERLVHDGHPDIKVHDRWWVIDNPIPQAFTLGSDLYLTTGLLAADYLPGVVAHEMARLYQNDGKMAHALRSMVFPFVQYRTTSIGQMTGIREETVSNSVEAVEFFGARGKIFLYALVLGGFSLLWYKKEWAEYFRERAFLADKYVVYLNLEHDLLEYLKENKGQTTAVPFSTNWVPYAELRMDRVLGETEKENYTS